MISDAQKNRNVTRLEWRDLHLQKIVPSLFVILLESEGLRLARRVELAEQVLVRSTHCAEVAKVPVECSFVPGGALRNGWHDEVSAITRVT
jgi:hypothetical protein